MLLTEGKYRIILPTSRNAVKHITAGDDSPAVDIDSHIRVNTRISTGRAGLRNHRASVDDEPAVGVNAVALSLPAVNENIDMTAIHGGDRYAVFIGVNSVVTGNDVDIAAVDGQVQFAVQPLIFRIDIENTAFHFTAADIHGHFGIHSTVIFVQLLAVQHLTAVLAERAGFVNLRYIRTVDRILTAVGNYNIGAGCRSVHIHVGIVGVPTFIDIVKNDRRRHLTGYIHTVKHQCHHGVRVALGVLTQIDGNLPGRQLSAQDVSAGFGNMHHRVGIRFFLSMRIVAVALTVGNTLSLQVKDNVMCRVNGGIGVLTVGLSIDRNAVIAKTDLRAVRLVLTLRHAAGHKAQQHQRSQ